MASVDGDAGAPVELRELVYQPARMNVCRLSLRPCEQHADQDTSGKRGVELGMPCLSTMGDVVQALQASSDASESSLWRMLRWGKSEPAASLYLFVRSDWLLPEATSVCLPEEVVPATGATEAVGGQNAEMVLVPLPTEMRLEQLLAVTKVSDTPLPLYYSRECSYGDGNELAICAICCALMACCMAAQASSAAKKKPQSRPPRPNEYYATPAPQYAPPPQQQYYAANTQPNPGYNTGYYANNQYGQPPNATAPPAGYQGAVYGQPVYYSQPPPGASSQYPPPQYQNDGAMDEM